MGKCKVIILIVYLIIDSGIVFAQKDVHSVRHTEQLREQIDLMVFTPPKYDQNGRLLPKQSYSETLNRSMAFILDSLDGWFKGDPRTLYDENGRRREVYYYYSNLALDGRPFKDAPDNHVSYPASQHATFINTFLNWYIYSGDDRALKQATELADWNIAHSTATDLPYGGIPYSTYAKGSPGGFKDANSIMPDKAAMMAAAYLNVYEITRKQKYYEAAYRIAKELADNQLPDGNWPFRVNPRTKEAKESYTSSIISQIDLFEKMINLSGKKDLEDNKVRALSWLFKNPIKTANWSGYYEDIGNIKNRTNNDCIETARYLLAHGKKDPGYLKVALKLYSFVMDTVILNGQTFVNREHLYPPSEGLREQKVVFVTMSSHSAHWAVFLADLYGETNDRSFKRRAIQAMNFVTYHLQPNGEILVGIDYMHDRDTWSFNQYWFSVHLKTDLYLMEFLRYFPELASDKESHILSVSSGINEIRYNDRGVSFHAWTPGSALLKLSFEPKQVIINGDKISEDKWYFNKKKKTLKIRYEAGYVDIS